MARLQAGQSAAAAREFRRALELVEKRLADDPNNQNSLSLKARALHYLGAHDEAEEKTYRLFVEINDSPPPELAVLFETADRAIDGIAAGHGDFQQFTAASLRLDPTYDPVRDHPRYLTLLARAEADPETRRQQREVRGKRIEFGFRSARSPLLTPRYFPGQVRRRARVRESLRRQGQRIFLRWHQRGVAQRAREDSRTEGDGAHVGVFLQGKAGADRRNRATARRRLHRRRQRAQGRQPRAHLRAAHQGERRLPDVEDNFDRDLKDIFAVQDEIAGLVAQQLSSSSV